MGGGLTVAATLQGVSACTDWVATRHLEPLTPLPAASRPPTFTYHGFAYHDFS